MVTIEDPSIIYADAEEIAAMKSQEQRRVRLYLAPLASCEDIAGGTNGSSPAVARTRRSSNRPDLCDDLESDSPRRSLLLTNHDTDSEKGEDTKDSDEVCKVVQKIIPPDDEWNLVYITLVIHGIGTLMPWNMFITAKDYFVDYKLSGTDYANNFLPYIGFASQVPNVIFNWLNIFVQLGGNFTTRVIGSILIEVCVFVGTVILAMIDSSEWPGEFFWTTMSLVVVLNMAGGIYQNTVYGMAAKLPFKYTGAVVLGSNISGTFTSVVNIIAIAMAPSVRTSAIYYFITALFVLLVCFDTFFALPLNKFYRYNEAIVERQDRQKRSVTGAKPRTPYWEVFKKCYPQCFNVFFVFFVSLAIFPTVHSDIRSTDTNFFIEGRFFTAITCFLTFNATAMFGNMIPNLFAWPGPKFLWIPVALRALLIPYFLMCNYLPLGVVRTMPVLITSDWAYWFGAVLLGLSSGYYSSLAMMYCPRTVEPEHASTAGMFAAASLITGIFAGINFSLLMPVIVSASVFKS